MKPYTLLPFRFERINSERVFLSNFAGEHIFLTSDHFAQLTSYTLATDSDVFHDLKSKQIVAVSDIESVIEMLSVKFRTKKNFLSDFTSLHMVVPTLICNSNCSYCQVSRKNIDATGFNMDKRTAKNTVDMIFKSPSQQIKIEFQGGEPLLNYPILQYMIEYAEYRNIFERRHLEFVICTNLTLMTEDILTYLKKHRVYISTSLDGPKDLHNKNRPLQSYNDSYDKVIEKIKLCREILGHDSVSALMTATSHTLGRFREVIDEYVEQGFNSIFLRSLNPYGFARRDKDKLAYSMDNFIDEYKDALMYILDLNNKGIHFSENFATLLFTRILTPFSTGFVDLQSPAGVGISGAIYNYDGNVFVSDEARMLSSTGDNKFLIGNVNANSHDEIFNGEFIRKLIGHSCLECLPECSYCAYQSYCGADPVRNYSENGDIVGHRSKSDICRRNKEIIKFLLNLIENSDNHLKQIIWSWIGIFFRFCHKVAKELHSSSPSLTVTFSDPTA